MTRISSANRRGFLDLRRIAIPATCNNPKVMKKTAVGIAPVAPNIMLIICGAKIIVKVGEIK